MGRIAGFFGVALLLSPAVFAQDEDPDALLPAPEVATTAAAADGFVPAGWKILQKADGDLDGDGRTDLVLILENAKQPEAVSGFHEESEIGRKFWPRILVVALAQPTADYRRLLANNNFITAHQFRSLDDVLEDEPIGISKGVLSVTFHQFASMGGWSMGSTTYKFRFRDGAMSAIGLDRYTVHRATLDYSDTSMNFLSHRARVVAGNEGEDPPTKPKTTWHRFDDEAPDLAEIEDGLDYWPESLAELQ